MYKPFYSLKENPFNITADPAFFFPSLRHEEAFNHLSYGISSRKGIIVITGEIGTGKTTLCRMLLNRLGKNVRTALILNPNFSDIQLLSMIARDLGLEHLKKNRLELTNTLNEFLLEESSRGGNVALIIDECQHLNTRQLEQIRLLSNLETEKDKLLQIILVGQPELNAKLGHASLRQLDQRISVRYHILPLERQEIGSYIDHRLRTAQADKRLHFTEEALNAVYTHSKGTPRVINILADRALLMGFVRETFTIDHSIIDACIKELQPQKENTISYEYHS